jgi:tetratricopeptide (TPR) repeat protein
MGEFDKALAYSDRSIRLARELQNPYAEAANLHYRGIIRDQQGDWQAALEDYKAAESVAEKAGDSFRLYIVKFMEGRAPLMQGEPGGRARRHRDLPCVGEPARNHLSARPGEDVAG